MTKHNAPETCPYRAYQIIKGNHQFVAYYDGGTVDGQPSEVKAVAVAQWMGLDISSVRHLLGTSICYVHWQEGQAVKMPTGKVTKG